MSSDTFTAMQNCPVFCEAIHAAGTGAKALLFPTRITPVVFAGISTRIVGCPPHNTDESIEQVSAAVLPPVHGSVASFGSILKRSLSENGPGG